MQPNCVTNLVVQFRANYNASVNYDEADESDAYEYVRQECTDHI